jgi:hypothetical protein
MHRIPFGTVAYWRWHMGEKLNDFYVALMALPFVKGLDLCE